DPDLAHRRQAALAALRPDRWHCAHHQGDNPVLRIRAYHRSGTHAEPRAFSLALALPRRPHRARISTSLSHLERRAWLAHDPVLAELRRRRRRSARLPRQSDSVGQSADLALDRRWTHLLSQASRGASLSCARLGLRRALPAHDCDERQAVLLHADLSNDVRRWSRALRANCD